MQPHGKELGSILRRLCEYKRVEVVELNETRPARQVIVNPENKCCGPLLPDDGPPKKPRMNLGRFHMVNKPAPPATRSYQAECYQYQACSYRLEFQGDIGKESYCLVAVFLALLESCLENEYLREETLKLLPRDRARLHVYYRFRRDFWDSSALALGWSLPCAPKKSRRMKRPQKFNP